MIKSGTVITAESFENNLSLKSVWRLEFADDAVNKQLSDIKKFYDSKMEEVEAYFHSKVEKLQSGDDMPQGVLKVVKVYIASKLKIQPW